MTLAKIENLTVTVRKNIKAPVEKVFKAFTEPSQIVKWFGCDKISDVQVSQDFKVGGKYHITGKSCDIGAEMSVHGVYTEIVPNQKVAYTWYNNSEEFPAADTLVSVQFVDKGDNTEIVLSHSKFASEKSKEGHTFGWTQSLEKFASLFAA